MIDTLTRTSEAIIPIDPTERVRFYIDTLGPSEELLVHHTPEGEAIITTGHGVVLNELLPECFFVQDTHKHLMESKWDEEMFLINLSQVIKTGSYGRAVLAHELGHFFADNQELSIERENILQQLFYTDITKSNKIAVINRIAQIDIQGELDGWECAKDIAELLSVSPEIFETVKQLAMFGHIARAFRGQLYAMETFVKPTSNEETVEIFDPYVQEKVHVTITELKQRTNEAIHQAVSAEAELRALLG
jgi:hypothetical protein